MTNTTVQGPDGGYITVEHPEGATDEEILAFARANYRPTPVKIGREGLGEAARQVGEEQSIGGKIGTGLGAGLQRLAHALDPLVGGALQRGAGSLADVAEFTGAGPVARPRPSGPRLSDLIAPGQSPEDQAREIAAQTVSGAGPIAQGAQIAGEVVPSLAVPAGFLGQGLARVAPQGLTRALAGSRAANVANIGASSAALSAATTPGGASERGWAAGLGGAAGTALPMAVAGAQGIRRMVAPVGGQIGEAERIARALGSERVDELVGALSQHGPTRLTMGGVAQPTAAQLTRDPLLQSLETGSRVKVPELFAQADELAAQGRVGQLQRIARGPEQLAAAETARMTATTPLREAALAAPGQGFEIPVARTAVDLLQGEARSNPAVATMANYVLRELEQGVTPAQLYTIRKTLTSGIPRGTELGSAISQAREQRIQLVRSIDDALDAASGGRWGEYMQTYQRLSQPVTSMRAGQAIEREFATTAKRTAEGDPILSAAKLRRSLEKHGQKQFGAQTLSRLTPEERATVNAIADSIEAETAARMAQGTVGSATAGNLAAAQRAEGIAQQLGRAGVEAVVPGSGMAMSAIGGLQKTRRQRILAELLQDPVRLAAMLQEAQRARAITQGVGATSRVARELPEQLPPFME